MLYLSALIGPFFLLLAEKFLPYPYLVEEIYKFFLVKKPLDTKTVFLLGLLFSLSEAIFYVLNPVFSYNLTTYGIRLMAVLPMHITTMLIMNYFNRRKNMWILGLILAILIHYLFNFSLQVPNLEANNI